MRFGLPSIKCSEWVSVFVVDWLRCESAGSERHTWILTIAGLLLPDLPGKIWGFAASWFRIGSLDLYSFSAEPCLRSCALASSVLNRLWLVCSGGNLKWFCSSWYELENRYEMPFKNIWLKRLLQFDELRKDYCTFLTNYFLAFQFYVVETCSFVKTDNSINHIFHIKFRTSSFYCQSQIDKARIQSVPFAFFSIFSVK